nr:odorant-binding protein 1 [Gregopimpla kuwanae]
MNFLAVNICSFAVLLLLVNYGESLRCRSGNQQNDDQAHKIMQKCRKKLSGSESKSGNDYTMSNENESSEEDSESVSSVEELFFSNNNKGSRANNTRNGGNYGQTSNDNYGDNRRSDRRKQDSSSSRPNYSYASNYSSMNDRGNSMSNMNENRNNRNGMQSQNRESNNDDRRNQMGCFSQCFFDELNLVDHRGFPERGSVMEMMTRGIQDPSLRDFIEESISECFYYIDMDTNNRDKCAFSSNLMSCFTDKGKERCEDWDDQ